jgi:PKD domain
MKASVFAGVLLGAALVGCGTSSSTSDQRTETDGQKVIKPLADVQPQINIVSPNREVAAGDTITMTLNSRNTLGRNVRVEWTTTGGSVTPQDNGRIARVQFDQPGAYTVTAKLYADEHLVDQDAVTITARPIR